MGGVEEGVGCGAWSVEEGACDILPWCVLYSLVCLAVRRSTTFSPEELLGMILNNTRAFAQEHAGVCVCVCVCV